MRRERIQRDQSRNRTQQLAATAIKSVVESLENRQYFAISYLTEGPAVTTGAQPVEVVAADFNGDGKLDAVTGDYTGKTLSAFLNDGAASFTLSQTIQLPADMKQLKAADMNGDGKLDIVVREFNGNNFSILPGNGDGTFGARATLNGSGGWNTFDLGDIDDDGDVDIVTGRSAGGQDGLYIFRNKGTANIEFESGQHFDGIGGVYHVHLADVNHDGKLDVMTVGPSLDAPAGIFLNLGNGQFGTHTGIQTSYGSTKETVTSADVNTDGNVDMIVQYQGGSFDVIPGNGAGGFGAPAAQSSLGSADIAIVDLDGDGKLDVVSASELYGAICVNPGFGNGTFDEDDKEYLFTSNVSDFQVGDFNGDGTIDVIVADGPDNELIFVQNTGTGGPTSPPPSVPPPPSTPGAFDLTAGIQAQLPTSVVGGQGKGKAAVAVTNSGTDAINGNVSVSLYASADGALDSADTLITSLVKKLKISAGKAKSVALKFVFPSLADGDYQILTKVEAAGETDTGDNVGLLGGFVHIAAPYVDLTPTVQTVTAKNGKLKTAIGLQNLGNSAATGAVTFTLSAVPEAGGAPVAIATVTRSVNIKSGAVKKVVASAALSDSLPAGNYKLAVTIDGLGDTVAGNNSVIGDPVFTIS